MPNYTFTRDIPATNNNPSNDQPIMTVNNNSTDSILDIDLYGFNDNNGGYHQKSTYVVQASDPVPDSTNGNQAIIYSKTTNAVAELYLTRNGSVTPVQMTRGAISATGSFSGNPASGYTFLPGGILLQWGAITATTGGTAFSFPVAFTTVFCVTGNIQAGGPQAFTIKGIGTTGATAQSSSGSQAVNWMAIGV